MIRYLFLMFTLASTIACNRNEVPPVIDRTQLVLLTDKAAYQPDEPVQFRANKAAPESAMIRYRHLNETIAEVPFSGTTWTWQPPSTDFKGYLAEVYSIQEGKEILHGTVAVDVSSDWTKFPRYGFLSKFGTNEPISTVFADLNRYHINGLQFYDWHYKHHQPLALNGSQPAATWQDIINRTISFQTVKAYIDAAHEKGMAAMMYNLAFGATKTGEADGVQPAWYLYKDASTTIRDKHSLPQPPFVSDIFLLDPGNSGWQDYLADRNQEVYDHLAFDGFHIDQLGDRGNLYNAQGAAVNLSNRYKPFVEAMKARHPDKVYAFNAVNQYGQGGIATSPVDFTYTEVWGPNDRYENLATILHTNMVFGQGKGTVLAAYMNYDLADRTGTFNTPAVLLTDAVIFAFGGSHLELGEHMLGKEYFPNNNLSMSNELKERLVDYYDFLVAYQNVLREGGAFSHPTVTGHPDLAAWPAAPGKIAVVGRDLGNRRSIQLINFSGITDLNWRDNAGNKPAPTKVSNINLSFTEARQVANIWWASPDVDGGRSQTLSFTQTGNQVSFSLPSLAYWNLVVMELN